MLSEEGLYLAALTEVKGDHFPKIGMPGQFINAADKSEQAENTDQKADLFTGKMDIQRDDKQRNVKQREAVNDPQFIKSAVLAFPEVQLRQDHQKKDDQQRDPALEFRPFPVYNHTQPDNRGKDHQDVDNLLPKGNIQLQRNRQMDENRRKDDNK